MPDNLSHFTYNIPAGATSGQASARAMIQRKTTPESTYIRNGIGPPGPLTNSKEPNQLVTDVKEICSMRANCSSLHPFVDGFPGG